MKAICVDTQVFAYAIKFTERSATVKTFLIHTRKEHIVNILCYHLLEHIISKLNFDQNKGC